MQVRLYQNITMIIPTLNFTALTYEFYCFHRIWTQRASCNWELGFLIFYFILLLLLLFSISRINSKLLAFLYWAWQGGRGLLGKAESNTIFPDLVNQNPCYQDPQFLLPFSWELSEAPRLGFRSPTDTASLSSLALAFFWQQS